MAFDLRTKAENEAPAAHGLEVPGDVGGRDRALGEGERDAGAQLDRRRFLRGHREREKGVVLCFDGDGGVVTELGGLAHLGAQRVPSRLRTLAAGVHLGGVRNPQLSIFSILVVAIAGLSREAIDGVKPRPILNRGLATRVNHCNYSRQ